MAEGEALAVFAGLVGVLQLLLAARLWAARGDRGFPWAALAALFFLNGLLGFDFIARALDPNSRTEEMVRQVIDAPTSFLTLYLAFALPPHDHRRKTAATLAATTFGPLFALHVGTALFSPSLTQHVNGLFASAFIFAGYGALALRLAFWPVRCGGRDVSAWLIFAFVVRAAEFAMFYPPRFDLVGPLSNPAAITGWINLTASVFLALAVVAGASLAWRRLRPPLASTGHGAAYGAAVLAGVSLGLAQRGTSGEVVGFVSVLSLFVLRPVMLGVGLLGRAYLRDVTALGVVASAFVGSYLSLAALFPSFTFDRLLLLAAGLGGVLAVAAWKLFSTLQLASAPTATRTSTAPSGPWDPELARGATEAFRAQLLRGAAARRVLPPQTRAALDELTLAERLLLALRAERKETVAGNESCSSRGLSLLLGTTAAVHRNFRDKVEEFERGLARRYGGRIEDNPGGGPLFTTTSRGRAVFYHLTPSGMALAEVVARDAGLGALAPDELRWVLNHLGSLDDAAKDGRHTQLTQPSR